MIYVKREVSRKKKKCEKINNEKTCKKSPKIGTKHSR